MNLLVVSINYFPEPTGFAPHTAALCESLSKHGHRVTVLTGFPFAPHWSRRPEYRRQLMVREKIYGVDVFRLTHFIPRKPRSVFQRLLMESSFCLSAFLLSFIFLDHDWDLVLYVGAQPGIAMFVRFLASLSNIPYVVKITDLASKVAHDVGIIKSSFVLKILNWFEYSAYHNSMGAIVLCRSFRNELILKRYPAERIRVIGDSVDLKAIRPVSSCSSFRRKNGFKLDDFLVLYSGSMGLKHGLINVIEAARILKNKGNKIKWLLAGDGEMKLVLSEFIENYNLQNSVFLLPFQPEIQLSFMLSASDVLLLNQLKNIIDAVIPSKLLMYMAVGKAVIAAVSNLSEGAKIIKKAAGGIVIEPENPEALAFAVLNLYRKPRVLNKMGFNNRLYAVRNFERQHILNLQKAFLLLVAKKSNYIN